MRRALTYAAALLTLLILALLTSPTQAAPSYVPAETATATATETPCTVNYSDVLPSDYFYEPVHYLACHGVLTGYADGTFRPYNTTTRGQLAKIITLGYNIPLQTPVAGQHTFADVATGSTFFPYIETVAASNIVAGYACGGINPQTQTLETCDSLSRPYYRPANDISRGQLSKVVVLAASMMQGWSLINPAGAAFYDVPVGSTFYQYIETAVCHGILGGYSDLTFRPNNSATRGQISKIVYLAITNNGACIPPPPAPTVTATVTATSTPPALPTATVTATPVPPLCGAGYHASAYVSNAYPSQGSTVTVYGSLCANGAPVSGAQMHTTWHYRTTTPTCDGYTDGNGAASCSRSIGQATVGYTVQIDVQFYVGGSLVTTTFTSFTPQ